ncbi:MAG: HAMP domain-containing histidine kinase [Dorea sp.]|jgi:signal transduction histidine kinase|nr:HAMP domain-containing histidine kinase [Dorea sp.]
MERECNKKIRKYFAGYLVFLILFSFFMYILARYETETDRQRILLLMTEHPELEAEIIAAWEKPGRLPFGRNEAGSRKELLESSRMAEMIEEKYGYDIGHLVSERIWWGLWGVGICIGTVWTVILGCLERKNRAGVRDKLWKLYERLEQFREGRFEGIPDYEADAEDYPEEWMKVWESLRELGVYFEGLKERLKEEENSTKAMITDISHQLKTPLASLRMCHELAVGDRQTKEEREEFQEREEREIEKLENLLKELVNLSRLETHMIQLKPRAGSIKKTIVAAVSQIYMKAKDKDIRIQADIGEDQEICHDPGWTEEALVNVFDNAVKYSGEHTVVTIRVKPLITYVMIEIEDEGIGIRKDELQKIYQRFYRGRDAAKISEEGAGVGLYLARMILERQGGSISAKQKRGNGTVFRITLPRVQFLQ